MLLTKLRTNKNSAKAKVTFCLCFLVFNNIVNAQIMHNDSIGISQLEKDIRIANPEVNFFKPFDFTDTYLYLQHTDLNFKRVQAPEKITKFGFASKGVFQLSPKVILSGNLDVSREDEKNVAFILTDERTTDQNYISNPSYYYVPRKSDWMKQNYQIGGNLAYQPIKNLFFTANVNGGFLKAYANSDPRPEIGNFRYDVGGKLGYKFRNHGLFLKMNYFNRKKESSIAYSVSELNAPSYYETYIRFNRGYGNYYYNDGYASSEYNFDGTSYGAEYQFSNFNHHFIIGYTNDYYIDRIKYLYSEQRRDENNQLNYFRMSIMLSGLKTERHNIYARYMGNFGKWNLTSALDVKDQKDQNYNYVDYNTSYRVYNFETNFRNVLSKYNDKGELLRFYFDAKYGDQDIKDISVVLQKKLSFLNYQIGVEKQYRINHNQKVAFDIRQGLYLPLDSELIYLPYQSTKENVFVKNIVMPDYFYDSSSRFSLGLKLKYLLDIKKVRYEMFVSGNQMFFVKNSENIDKSIYNTDKNSYYSFGINFYY